jgi:hypothetical protein
MSTSDSPQELDQQKLLGIAVKMSKWLDCFSGRIVLNSKFKLCIETECNQEVFPLTKAAAIACGCELSDMSEQQIRSVKQAMLKDIEPMIASAKQSVQEVNLTTADSAWEKVAPKPSDTTASRVVLDKIMEEAEDKWALLNLRIRILRDWCFFFDLVKMDEEPEQEQTSAAVLPKNKRAKTGK